MKIEHQDKTQRISACTKQRAGEKETLFIFELLLELIHN